MAVRFLGLRPMRVLADRSRDLGNGWGMAVLAPASTFRTTDLRKPLSAALLREYDLLVIAAISRRGYSPAELAAIEAFVHRGGTLILASNAGQFALWTGEQDMECLAQNSVAGLFGYRFLSAQGLAMDQGGVRGFEREEIAFTGAGKELGLQSGDLPLARPGALKVPDAATVLLVGGRDKLPVAACSQHGRGKVLIVHDTGMFSTPNAFIASHFIALLDPVARVEAQDRPAALIEYPLAQKQSGKFALGMTQPTQDHARRVLTIAQQLLPIATKLMPTPKGLKRWRIGLETGCGGWSDWGEQEYVNSHVGVEASDAALAATLATHLAERLLWAGFGWELRTMVRSMVAYMVDQILRTAGYAAHADLLLAGFRTHPTFAPRLDFARVYSEVETPASLKQLWFDLASEYGADFLTRTMEVVPEKDAYKHIDWRLWSQLDAVAWLMAQAVGKGIYTFLRGRKHTVREIPLKKAGSEDLGKAMRVAMAELVEAESEVASDRYDAACFLAERMGEDLKDDDKVAGKLRQAKVAEALPAGIHLAQRRDIRAVGALERFLTSADKGLRGMAALALVSECGEKSACTTLAELAGDLDTRFTLAAGYALLQLGDERGKPLAFAEHPACSIKVNGRGQVRANPCVDGYEVCNVYSTPMIRPAQYGGGFSSYYVDWVHTAPRWRRRGIARAGMQAGLDWHWDRDCATTSLHTGVRNVAHALYRDFNLSDYYRGMRFAKVLRAEATVQPPKGIKLSMVDCRQKLELMDFANRQQAIRPDHLREAGAWPETRIAVCARQGRQMVGFAAADVRTDPAAASLECLAIAEPAVPKPRKQQKQDPKKEPPYSPREQIGHALLSRLHAELLKKGVRKIETNYWRPMGEQDTPWLLRRAGYGSCLSGGVELYRMNSLEQFLRETLPAFQARLGKAEAWRNWCGRITLRAPEQAATLVIDHGKITVVKAQSRPASPEITISGSLSAIQRLAMGVTSAFEECYQIAVAIEPMLDDPMTVLLDCLFPRLMPDL